MSGNASASQVTHMYICLIVRAWKVEQFSLMKQIRRNNLNMQHEWNLKVVLPHKPCMICCGIKLILSSTTSRSSLFFEMFQLPAEEGCKQLSVLCLIENKKREEKTSSSRCPKDNKNRKTQGHSSTSRDITGDTFPSIHFRPDVRMLSTIYYWAEETWWNISMFCHFWYFNANKRNVATEFLFFFF